MNSPLERQMTHHLELLVSQGMEAARVQPWADERYSLLLRDASAYLLLAFGDYDRYSLTLRRLEVGWQGEQQAEPPVDLYDRIAAVTQQLNYLEQPIELYEYEPAEQVAILRSAPPERYGEQIRYWEVVLHSNQRIHMAYYAWSPAMLDRERQAYPLTFSPLRRFTASLLAVLAA
ncbi:MAG: hypothetical protein HC837_16290 [Chloroflexaceae bacterium]|nr:hypothetical protein [Chloroflexaceae bacterium]